MLRAEQVVLLERLTTYSWFSVGDSTRVYIQRDGSNKIFGSGVDGTVVISSDTILTQDMYYDNLTVNSTKYLMTNGFRVFVKGTLTNNGTIGFISGVTETANAATLSLRSTTNAGDFLGNEVGDTVSFSAMNDFEKLVYGLDIDATNGFKALKGGSTGAVGNAGTSNAGGVGAAGTGPNANTVASPGGKGSTGNPGTGGTAGSAGTGGGLVFISANIIAGSGTFVSTFTAGGNAGAFSNGNAGTAAPNSPGTQNPSGHASSHSPAYHYHAVCWPCSGHHSPMPFHHGSATNHHSHGVGHNPSYTGGAGGNAGAGNAGNAGTSGSAGTVVLVARTINTALSTTKSTSFDI